MNKKPKKEKNLECPVCSSRNISISKIIDEFEYGSGSSKKIISAEIDLRTCDDCKYKFTGYDAEEKRHEMICEHLGVLNPKEIISIRKNYNLTRKGFSEISGFGQATLARWETGQLFQNKANDNYLYLLGFEENFDRIRSKFGEKLVYIQIVSEKNLDRNNLLQKYQEFAPNERDYILASSFEL